ncbi:hypothetical protein JXD20_01560 [Candidatus Peregrinibacteria bacterium]|nr:hypothetical protein [Candidatus Peregrinibacteria bacterium]
MKTKLLALALALTFVMPVTALAEDAPAATDPVDEIRAEIQELRNYLTELREQVQNGELTKEEAKEAWKTTLAEIREKKEALFQDMMDKAEQKYENLAENNPELAEAIRNRFEGFTAARTERHERFKELRESFDNGEMDRGQYRLGIREAHQEFKAKRLEHKEQFRSFIQDRREQLRERRGMDDSEETGE